MEFLFGRSETAAAPSGRFTIRFDSLQLIKRLCLPNLIRTVLDAGGLLMVASEPLLWKSLAHTCFGIFFPCRPLSAFEVADWMGMSFLDKIRGPCLYVTQIFFLAGAALRIILPSSELRMYVFFDFD